MRFHKHLFSVVHGIGADVCDPACVVRLRMWCPAKGVHPHESSERITS